jgi:hypothetical protein
MSTEDEMSIPSGPGPFCQSVYEFNPRFGQRPRQESPAPKARQLPWWTRQLKKLSVMF